MSSGEAVMTGRKSSSGHDRLCGASVRNGVGTCRRPAGWGTDHPGIGRCKLHAGGTPVHRNAAERIKAARTVAEWGGRLDISPAEALLELVQTKAAEVAYWQHMTSTLDPDELAGMPLVRRKTAGNDVGDTYEAKEHLYVRMLHQTQTQLATFSAAAVKAGLDEALIRQATIQGTVLIEALRRLLVAVRADPDRDDETLIRGVLEGWK